MPTKTPDFMVVYVTSLLPCTDTACYRKNQIGGLFVNVVRLCRKDMHKALDPGWSMQKSNQSCAILKCLCKLRVKLKLIC